MQAETTLAHQMNRNKIFGCVWTDSNYMSHVRSVAERHRSVKFSRAKLNGDVHTDRERLLFFRSG